MEAAGTPEGGTPLSVPQIYTFSVIPEPSTYALLALGTIALLLTRLRRRRPTALAMHKTRPQLR